MKGIATLITIPRLIYKTIIAIGCISIIGLFLWLLFLIGFTIWTITPNVLSQIQGFLSQFVGVKLP